MSVRDHLLFFVLLYFPRSLFFTKLKSTESRSNMVTTYSYSRKSSFTNNEGFLHPLKKNNPTTQTKRSRKADSIRDKPNKKNPWISFRLFKRSSGNTKWFLMSHLGSNKMAFFFPIGQFQSFSMQVGR